MGVVLCPGLSESARMVRYPGDGASMAGEDCQRRHRSGLVSSGTLLSGHTDIVIVRGKTVIVMKVPTSLLILTSYCQALQIMRIEVPKYAKVSGETV